MIPVDGEASACVVTPEIGLYLSRKGASDSSGIVVLFSSYYRLSNSDLAGLIGGGGGHVYVGVSAWSAQSIGHTYCRPRRSLAM